MDNARVAKELVKLAKTVIGADTFPCPECGTKVLKQTGYCVKCQKKVKEASVANKRAAVELVSLAKELLGGKILGPSIPDGTGPYSETSDCPFTDDDEFEEDELDVIEAAEDDGDDPTPSGKVDLQKILTGINALYGKFEPTSDEAIFLGMVRDISVHIRRGNAARVKALAKEMIEEFGS